MLVLLFFAFASGLVTIFAPCIWPLLPIVLSASTTGGRKKPFGISLGIITSFAFFTLTISYIVKIIPFDPNILRLFAVVVIGILGLTLVIPRLAQMFEGWVSRLASSIGTKAQQNQGEGFKGGFVTGVALGIVWSPCAGPILATIATLAATRTVNIQIILVTLAYVIGVGIPLFLFTWAGSRILTKSRILSKYTGRIQQVFGVIMILTAIAIYTNYDKIIQVKLLDSIPTYSQFLYKLENSEEVKKQLDMLRQKKEEMRKDMPTGTNSLPNLGTAPEFTGIHKWLNSDPLTMESLRGKVVLIDFWTYTCINCIRTLPHIVNWYEKYKDQGFVVVGVHTPEFEFEKKTENVLGAIKQYNIRYPVAQDNDYKTWRAYDNHYWPAKYLIDAEGNIRYTHFGEGEYDVTEENIQKLLEEAGQKVKEEVSGMPDETPTGDQTPETYLGSLRMERKADSPEGLPLHYFSLDGNWATEEEYSISDRDASLTLHFYAAKVFLVITPREPGTQVKVYLDGKFSKTITLDNDRLYELVNLPEKGDHILRLEFPNKGTQIFAFTFG